MGLKEDIREYIRIRLGGESVDVDLSDKDYAHCADTALETLGAWMPKERMGAFNATAQVQKYVLDSGTWGRGIFKVQRPLLPAVAHTMWPLPAPYVLSAPVEHLGDYGWSLIRQKESENLFGASFTWDFDRDSGILLLKPPPNESGVYVYWYYDNPRLEEIKGRALWVKKYALAVAKTVVGAKYSKFESAPGTDNPVQLNKAIYQEGLDTMDKLEEEIRAASASRTPPIPTFRQG